MEGQEVVTSDGQRLGHVVAERDDCVIVEMGHVFKTKHAIPRQFLHEHDGELRATVTKHVVADSPKVDLEHWDAQAIRLHYGVEGTFEVNPDPDGLESAGPTVHERQANAADPSGTTAKLDERDGSS